MRSSGRRRRALSLVAILPKSGRDGIWDDPYVTAIPDFVTHYHLPDRDPFLNLSDLQDDRVEEVLAGLAAAAETGSSERRFGPRYMKLRRQTEELLRARFIEAGGRPVRQVPHYFVLGESEWFRGLYRKAREVRIPLSAVPTHHVSFTYPDSVTSMGLLPEFGIHVARQPYHGIVYRIEELAVVAGRYGLPQGSRPRSYQGHQHKDFEHYIEVQIWADDAVTSLMR
jgi:hypothetical protein